MGLTRRRFIGLAWTSEQAVSTFPTSADPTTELVFMSATKLAQSIRDKKVGSLEVVRACLAQIGKVNPRLNAVVQLCEERALMEARDADTLLAKGRLKSPLHGVPMTIKDSFDTAGVVSTGATLGRRIMFPRKTQPSWHDCARRAPSCWARRTRRSRR
jgi:amidase